MGHHFATTSKATHITFLNELRETIYFDSQWSVLYHYSEITLIFVPQQAFSYLHKFFNSLCGQCNILHSLHFWFWFQRCYLSHTWPWFWILFTAIHLLLHHSFLTKHSLHSWLTTTFKTNSWLHLIKWQPQPTNLWLWVANSHPWLTNLHLWLTTSHPHLTHSHPWFTTLHLWPLIQSWICLLPFTEVYISMYILHFSPHGYSKFLNAICPHNNPILIIIVYLDLVSNKELKGRCKMIRLIW